jgi:hypothetical protein
MRQIISTLRRRYNLGLNQSPQDRAMGKFHQYAKIAFIGSTGLSMVIGEQPPHIEQDGPIRGAFFEPVVAGTSSSISTYLGTSITTFGR